MAKKILSLYIYIYIYIYTRVSQKFCNILITWGTIQQLWILLLINVMNHTGLWDAEFTLYSPRTTMTLSFRIYGFRPTWPCLIVEVWGIIVLFFFNLPSCFIECRYYWTWKEHSVAMAFENSRTGSLIHQSCSLHLAIWYGISISEFLNYIQTLCYNNNNRPCVII